MPWAEYRKWTMQGKQMIMPFGKYKGMLIENIPSDYLRWVARECDDDAIAAAADEEYQWREGLGEHFYARDIKQT